MGIVKSDDPKGTGGGIDPAALAAAIFAGALTVFSPPGPWSIPGMLVGLTLLLLLFAYDKPSTRTRLQSAAFSAVVALACVLIVGYPLEVICSTDRAFRLAAFLSENPARIARILGRPGVLVDQSYSDVPPVAVALIWAGVGFAVFRFDERRSHNARVPPDKGATPGSHLDGGVVRNKTVDEEAKALEEAFGDPIKTFEFLYGNLSILDSKASSLMAFNAIGLAALAVWLEYVPQNLLHLGLDVVFLLFLASSGICFVVVRIAWQVPNVTPLLQTAALIPIRDRRTRWYRASWWLSVFAVSLFALVSVVHTFCTWGRATNSCGSTCCEFCSPRWWGNRDPTDTGCRDIDS